MKRNWAAAIIASIASQLALPAAAATIPATWQFGTVFDIAFFEKSFVPSRRRG
jgi:hypothetical protein